MMAGPPVPDPAPAPPPPCGGGGGGGPPSMVGSSPSSPPRLIDRFSRRLTFHCDAPRALLRPTPNGRSLNTVSPLSATPVVMLYGGADEYWAWMLPRNENGNGVASMANTRCLMSIADGPQSASGLVLSAGSASGESVWF